jgi:hypothetical protein
MTVDPFPDIRTADDLADTSRFALIPVPDEAGLAGQVRLVVEQATGRRWFAKAATAEFDAANEVICARLAQPLGLARPRAAFVAGRGDLVLIQHVADHPDQGELLAAGVDIAGEPSLFGPDQAALGRLAQDLADPASLLSELLGAFLVDNDDAGNDRNWLVLSLAGRAPLKRIVAIDQGFALLGRGPQELGAASYQELLSERLQVDLPGYLRQWTAPTSMRVMLGVAAAAGLVSAEELAAAYDRFVAMARPALRTLDLADVDPAHARRCWRLLTGRLELLEAERDAYLMVLSGASP